MNAENFNNTIVEEYFNGWYGMGYINLINGVYVVTAGNAVIEFKTIEQARKNLKNSGFEKS